MFMDQPLIMTMKHVLVTTVSCVLCVTAPTTSYETTLNKVQSFPDDCYTEAATYTGQKNITVSGKKCQAWSLNTPHDHSYHKDNMFPDGKEINASNFCRDPSKDGYLWCYTLDPAKRWEECPIWLCNVPDWTKPCIKDETSGNCYQIIDTKITWNSAYYWCKRDGGNLVIIESSEEQEFLADLMKKRIFNVSGLWIGSDKLHPEDQRAWTNGEKFSYTNWARGEPNSPLEENCVEIYTADGTWNDIDCKDHNGYICENSDVIANYMQDDTTGISYKLVDTLITWVEAYNKCVKDGGMLMTIETSHEQTFIAEKIERKTFQAWGLWLGSNKVHPEKSRTWTNKKKFTYANWAEGEPNNAPLTENCAEMFTSTRMWNDEECTSLRGLICEKPPQVTPDRSQRQDFVIGIAVGSTLVLGACVLLLFCLIRKRCRKHIDKDDGYQDVQEMNQAEHVYRPYIPDSDNSCNPENHYSTIDDVPKRKEIY